MNQVNRTLGAIAACALALGAATTQAVQAQDALAEGFAQPPESAKPHGWWR